MTNVEAPGGAFDIVLAKGEDMPSDAIPVKGFDFNKGLSDVHSLLSTYFTTGFQATHFGRAVKEIEKMLDTKAEKVPEDSLKPHLDEPGDRPVDNCTIFLGYTSNLISSGIRETIRYLVEHNMVDCLVTTAGGIEEDFIKCLSDTYLGDFRIKGKDLRVKGINRTGNLLVPNNNYCKFEEWIMPILDRLVDEQKSQGKVWSPSSFIAELGKEINNPQSVYYWAYKNNIPVFCPAITDGSIGDMIYFHSFKKPGLIMDIVQGIVVCATNDWNGADYAVYVNTGQEFDGSDAGATPDEAISWGKIKHTANPVKVYADATLVFPLLVAETFARRRGDVK